MGVKFRKYREGDVFRVRIRHGDALNGPVCDFPGPSWTMIGEEFGEDRPLLVFGIINAAPGVGTLWAYISDDARGHGVAMVKFGRARMDEAFEIMKYNRVQAVVRTDRPEYERFIELLGFEKEGTMRNGSVGGEHDVFLYSRIS